MKKSIQQLFLLLAVAGMGFLASCGDDDEATGPSIEFQEGPNLISMDTTLPGDTTVRFGIDAEKGSFDMENFMVTINDILVMDIPLTGDSTSDFSAQMDVPLPNISDEYDIEASVTDADGRTATAGLIITVVARDTSVMINNVRMLAAPLDTYESETFYSTKQDSLYSMDDVINTSAPISPNIDFGYAYGATRGAILASPGNYPSFVTGDYKTLIESQWGTRNLTEFRTTTLSATEFDAITVFDEETIVDEYEAGTPVGTQVEGLSAGDVIAFQTKTNQGASEQRFGLLKVVSIEPGAGENDFIEIQVKVQD